MKYGWYVDQKVIHDLGLLGKIDLVDIGLLMYIKDFCSYPGINKIFDNGKEYYWLSYQKLTEDMPLLGLNSKSAVYKRFKKLCNLDLLEQHQDNELNYRPYYGLGNMFFNLVRKDDPRDLNHTPPSPKSYAPRDGSTTYYNTNDSRTSSVPSESSIKDYAGTTQVSPSSKPIATKQAFFKPLETKEILGSTESIEGLLFILYDRYPTVSKEDIRTQFEKGVAYLLSSSKEYKDQQLFLIMWMDRNMNKPFRNREPEDREVTNQFSKVVQYDYFITQKLKNAKV